MDRWNDGAHDRRTLVSPRAIPRIGRSPSRPPSRWTPRPRPCRRRATGDRFRGRRTRLPDPGLHRRGGRRRLPRPPQPPLHPRRRPARAQGGDRGEDRARLRLPGQRGAGAGHQRRQAGRLRRVRHAARPGRRGAAARAVLDDLPGGDPAGRRRAGRGRRRRGQGYLVTSSSSRPRGPRAPRCCCSAPRPTRPARCTPPTRSAAIGRWADEHGLWVVTDEIYEHLVYGGAQFSSIPVQVPELADRCVVVNGVAKTYAMTGWRVGWLIGPPDVVKARQRTCSRTPPRTSRTCPARRVGRGVRATCPRWR